MKKILALLLALCMIFALAACGETAPAETKPAEEPAAEEPAAEAPASEEPAAEEPAAEEPAAEEASDAAAALVSDAFIDPLADWAQYDELIAQIKAETDFAKRTELMHQAEDILMATNCVIPIYYYNDIYMQKDYVSGIYANPFATKFFMYSKLDNGSDTLRLNLSSEPDYLDPALNSSVDGACLAANAFSGLYTYNAEGVTVPACAEGYTVSEDGLTYTVTLKDGLKWSDGSDLTAADFEYSWKRATAPATAADYEYMFSGFDGYGTPLGTSMFPSFGKYYDESLTDYYKPDIKKAKALLKEAGYLRGAVDGDYGRGTQAAVSAFQKANGLEATGHADKETIQTINRLAAEAAREAEQQNKE